MLTANAECSIISKEAVRQNLYVFTSMEEAAKAIKQNLLPDKYTGILKRGF